MKTLIGVSLIAVLLLWDPAVAATQNATPEVVERSLGLPSTRDSGTEIRVWLRSIVRVNQFYRLIKTDAGVTAERYAIAPVVQADRLTTARDARRETDSNRRYLKEQRCSGKIVETPDLMWCRVTIQGGQWAVTFDDLMPEELWKLPPQEQTRCGSNGDELIILDGEAVHIDLIERGRRRQVEYSNPDVCCKTVACAIADHVRNVIRNIH